MRFSFSTPAHGDCVIDVDAGANGPVATVWVADRQNEPGTSYAGSPELRSQVGNILTASQAEKIARIAISNFEGVGAFPGRTDVVWGDHEWQGELNQLG